MNDCIFCRILAGEIPSKKLYEDEQCLAFYDIQPLAPQHFLVIPKAHIASAAELGEEQAALVGHIFAVIAKLTKELMQRAHAMVGEVKELKQRLDAMKDKLFSGEIDRCLFAAREVGGLKVLTVMRNDIAPNARRR